MSLRLDDETTPATARRRLVLTVLVVVATLVVAVVVLARPQRHHRTAAVGTATATTVESALATTPDAGTIVRSGDGSPTTSATPTTDPARSEGDVAVEPATPVIDASAPVARDALRVAVDLVALDERRMVSASTATQLTAAVAAPSRREVLVAQAVRQSASLHAQMGDDVVVLSHPLRARIVQLDATVAVVDVWWVKVISGPHRPYAGDVWGTTRVTLFRGESSWLVANEASDLGPWPTHSSTVHHDTGEVFDALLDGYQPVVAS